MKILFAIIVLTFLLASCGSSNPKPNPNVSTWNTAKWNSGKWEQ